MAATTIDSAVTPPQQPKRSSEKRIQGGLLDPKMLLKSTPATLRKLDPTTLWRNPVMFIVEIGAVWSTILAIIDPSWFAWLIVVWLWLTVVFANLAEAVAEGRGKAQAESLRKAKTQTLARRLVGWEPGVPGVEEEVAAPLLRQGDIVVVEAGQAIPGDGDVVDGIASVDESAITGESAPVIRESGGDRSAVTGGTTVLSDRIVVRITQKPGESFIDRMIALVEGANRQKTPNEIALNILLAALTIIFVFAVATLQPLAIYSKIEQPGRFGYLGAQQSWRDRDRDGVTSCVLDPDHNRRAAVRDRHRRHGPARAAQCTGDVGSRRRGRRRREHAAARQDRHDHVGQSAGRGVRAAARGLLGGRLADAAQLSSLADETPEGRSVVVFAKQKYGLRARTPGELAHAQWVQFTAATRMSGVNLDGHLLRKGAASSVAEWVRAEGGEVPTELGVIVDGISAGGGTPLVVGHAARRQGVGAGRDPPQGCRQAGHAGAVRRDAPDGHPDRDDHR